MLTLTNKECDALIESLSYSIQMVYDYNYHLFVGDGVSAYNMKMQILNELRLLKEKIFQHKKDILNAETYVATPNIITISNLIKEEADKQGFVSSLEDIDVNWHNDGSFKLTYGFKDKK